LKACTGLDTQAIQMLPSKRVPCTRKRHPPKSRWASASTCRHWEEAIHAKEVLLEKVALKNSTYKAAVAKLEAQLAHKAEMGEMLHLVDFEQLQIENQQHMEMIDAKNKELLQLKLTTGKTVQVGGWLAGGERGFGAAPTQSGRIAQLIDGACVAPHMHGQLCDASTSSCPTATNRAPQALNAAKAELTRLDSDQYAVSGEISSRRQELAAFERNLTQTKAQAAAVEQAFRQLEAEHHDT
jgi:predicted  nucleic acid-binding Zn-ribbon protein